MIIKEHSKSDLENLIPHIKPQDLLKHEAVRKLQEKAILAWGQLDAGSKIEIELFEALNAFDQPFQAKEQG